MLEYQFIQFADGLPTREDCETFVPVDDNHTTNFFTYEPDYPSDEYTQRCDLITPDGVLLQKNITYLNRPYPIGESASSKTVGIHQIKKELRKYLAPGNCCRLRLMEISEETTLAEAGTLNMTGEELRQHTLKAIGTETKIPDGARVVVFDTPQIACQMSGLPSNLTTPTPMKVTVWGRQSINTATTLSRKREIAEIVTKGGTVELPISLTRAMYISITVETVDDRQYSAGELTHKGITISKQEAIGYSNILQVVENQGKYSQIKYGCNEYGTFGFPFEAYYPNATPGSSGTTYLQCLVPLIIKRPQFNQSDKVYEKSNGEQVILYANYTKEYNGETDYIAEETHEKIMIALNCDQVFINGQRLTKSDKYEIDWDNETQTDCGTKLVRATFKMKANITTRNGNC